MQLLLKLLNLLLSHIFILLVVYLVVGISFSWSVSIVAPKWVLTLSFLEFKFLLLSFVNDWFLVFGFNRSLDWLTSWYKGILLILWRILKFLLLKLSFVLLDKIVLSWLKRCLSLISLIMKVIGLVFIIALILIVIGVEIIKVLIHLVLRWLTGRFFKGVVERLGFWIDFIAFFFEKQIVHDLIG